MVSAEYDSMFAKLVAVADTREPARQLLEAALDESTIVVSGGASNRSFLKHIVQHGEFRSSSTDIEWLDRLGPDQTTAACYQNVHSKSRASL